VDEYGAINNYSDSETGILFLTSCTTQIVGLDIYTTFQLAIIKKKLKAILTCGTNVTGVRDYAK
jgi:hypothetical protein